MKQSVIIPFIIWITLALATIAAYFTLNHNGFIGFDDQTYIYQNQILQKGIGSESLSFAFSLENKTSYWHPLTWLSLMIDYELWGLNPAGYHLENLFWHIANGTILFLLLQFLTKKTTPSALVSLLFLLHPVNVESIAWAVERKTVLSTFFFLSTIALYIRYTQKNSLWRYLPIVIFMALGLMAKSMIITLPIILLLLDMWPLGRLNMKSDGGPAAVIALPLLIEKIPLLLLSVTSVVISLLSHSSTVVTAAAVPISSRIGHAIVSYCQHLGKLFWPTEHLVYYPLPQNGHNPSTIALCFLLLLSISTLVIKLWRNYPELAIGWYWFIITFAPVSGLIRAGKWPAMADRFLYIPQIGIFIAIIFFTSRILESKTAIIQKIAVAVAITIALFFGYKTSIQTKIWLNSSTLFGESLRVNPNDDYSHYLLGRSYFMESKKTGLAEKHLKIAISLNDREPYYHADLGEVYLNMKKPEAALPHLEKAAQRILSDAEIFNSLGSAYLELNRHEEALPYFEKALAISPNHHNALFNKGIALYKQQNFKDAKNTFEKLLQTDPGNIDARTNLGMTFIELKEYENAIIETKRVLKAAPDDINALINLATALEKTGDKMEAYETYKKAITLQPDATEAIKGMKRLSAR